jgi:hypothetical protein
LRAAAAREASYPMRRSEAAPSDASPRKRQSCAGEAGARTRWFDGWAPRESPTGSNRR